MLNDRNDRHDEHEESEYHFSDDDVSYEVEPETAKSVSVEPKESILNRLTRSKRMLISLVVFLVLVFVVYKMVAPSATNVAQITPPVMADTQQTMTPQQAAGAQQVAQQAAPMPQAPANAQPAQMNEPMMAPPAPPVPDQTAMVPQGQPMPQQAAPAGQMPQQQAMPGAIPPAPPTPVQAQQANQPVVGMPTVIPVESTISPAQPGMMQPGQQPGAPPPQMVTVPIAQVSATAANPQAANDQVLGQMQADYTQKINDNAAQTKFVQDQMQALSARVAVMESQLNQIVQTLTRPSVASQAAPAAPVAIAPPAPPPSIEPKVSYSVQAIIPGRAWLKSDSGETVTVAEGDVIKDLGRVTKIDPYDGIVEVNTGSRIVSISYGNGT